MNIDYLGLFKSVRFAVVLLIVFLLQNNICGAADADIAHVTDIKGTAAVHRGLTIIEARKGTALKLDDVLVTGPEGAIGIIFADETTISLGPESKLSLEEFVFEPERSRFSFVVKLMKGTAAYVSGLIAKLSPEAARFITPSASIGVRGTRFVVQVENV